MSTTETIVWFDVDERLPYDDVTVMLSHPTLNEPVWLGYHCDGCWCDVQGGLLPYHAVKSWAEMPVGTSS